MQAPTSNHYIEQLILTISGEIDFQHFKKAWTHVVQVNDALRTFFRWEKLEKPVQVVLRQHHPTLDFFDLSTLTDDVKKQKRFEQIIREDRQAKFDLREVPFRVILCKAANEDTEKKLGEIGIIPHDEKRQILEEFNHPNRPYPLKTVTGLFEEQLEMSSSSTACFHEENYITFEELNKRVHRLANLIEDL